ncbi:helix-turn-helix domain-containing protein [Azospirillum sp. sgz302134]
MNQLCLSVEETQRTLGVGRTSVYKLINEGKLEIVKIGRRTLIKIASVRAVAGEA